MPESEPSPMFEASEVHVVPEGLLFVCADEAEAQRAYCEGQIKGRKVKVDGRNLIMLKSEKESHNEGQTSL